MRLIERINALAKIGQTPEGICRISGTKEDLAGKSLVVQWMLDAGMSVRRDGYNNIIGRLDGVGAPIVTGSHTDTVPTAGKFDGALGVIAAIEAAEELKGQLNSPLEVIIFDDEENTMSGSLGYCAEEPNILSLIHI